MTPILMNEQEASIFLNVSVSKLQKSRGIKSTLIAEGKVPPYVKVDGSVRYVVEDLRNFVNELQRFGAGGKIFEPAPQEKKVQAKKPVSLKQEVTPSDDVIGMPEELANACAFLN